MPRLPQHRRSFRCVSSKIEKVGPGTRRGRSLSLVIWPGGVEEAGPTETEVVFPALGEQSHHSDWAGVESQPRIMSVLLEASRRSGKGVVDQRCKQGPSHRWGAGARLHPAAAGRLRSARGVSMKRPISLETWVKCNPVRHALPIFSYLWSPPSACLSTHSLRGEN